LSGCFALCAAPTLYPTSTAISVFLSLLWSGRVRRCTPFYATLALLEGSVLAAFAGHIALRFARHPGFLKYGVLAIYHDKDSACSIYPDYPYLATMA
jgi:hypothetical protein